MARLTEGYDELSDPNNLRDISYQQILSAAERLKEGGMKTTAILPSKYQKDFQISIFYKMDSCQRTGSSRERGMLNALLKMPLDKRKSGVIMSSLGDSAMALCYHGIKLRTPVVIVMPVNVSISLKHKCQNLGAKVITHGTTLTEAQTLARSLARDKQLTYLNGRDDPNVLEGLGTVALEILEELPSVDAILVPVGTGGLVAAVGTVIKHDKPKCLVYGVQPEAMPVFFNALQTGEPKYTEPNETIARTLVATTATINAFHNAKNTLNKMLLVKEDWIARGVLHLLEEEHFVIDGASACTIAAVLGSLVPELKTKTVVCILSSGNIDSFELKRCCHRGLAAEGRLIDFKVSFAAKLPKILEMEAMDQEGVPKVYLVLLEHIIPHVNIVLTNNANWQ